MYDRRCILLSSLASFAAMAPRPVLGSKFGEFDRHPLLKFIGDGKAVVEQPLSFTDPDGLIWTAPSGTIVDGASIPRPLWSIVGAPFRGNYVRASIIHDHYCSTRERDWRDTHLAFYYGCKSDGLSNIYAKLLYTAVMTFGPRWLLEGQRKGGDSPHLVQPEFDQEVFDELRQWIEENDPSLNEMNRRIL